MNLADFKSTFPPMPDICAHLGVELNSSRMIHCPAHSETTPSCRVYEDHIHCFGCGAHLDSIDLVRHVRGCDFWEALGWLAREFGLSVPHRDPEVEARYEAQRSIGDLYGEIVRAALQHQDVAVEYLTGRGVSGDVAMAAEAGYLPPSYQITDRELAARAGLLNKNGGFLFAGRLVIPIRWSGQIVNLYGRIIEPNEHRPTHVYCGATEPSMPAALWGLDDIPREAEIWLCEGIIDAMTLRTHGYQAVACFGTQGFTDKRLQLLKRRNPSRVIVCFDADPNGSGQKAALVAAEKLFRAGIEVEIVTLPADGAEKTDANSYFQDHGRDDFQQIPRRDYIDFALHTVPTNLSPRQKYEMVKPILDAVGTQPELCWKDYVSRIAIRFPEYDRRKLEKIVGVCAQAASKDGGGPFLPLACVENIREKQHVIFFDGRFFKYEAGCYRAWYGEEVDRATIRLIGQETQSHHVESVRKFLGIVSFVRAELVNPRDKLNLANGILDLDAGILTEHSPEFISTIQSRTLFDPGAECPLWLQTIEEILPDPQSRQLLAQIFGYCLTADVSHQKGFIFYGEGSNGKSLLTDVMAALLGPENCSALHLSDFKERFRLSELQNRLVNFSAEVEAKGFVNDARVKVAITGDSLTAERKNQPPFAFRSFAKLIVSCNNLPRTTDKTHGYFRRWTILPFTRTFSPEKRDRSRAKRIIDAELPGVLNWAIGGYRSLTEAGTFVESVASREALQEYRREADPTVSFIEERTTVMPGSEYGTTLPVLYDAYRKWASENGYEALGKIRFRRAVERITGLQVDRNADAMYFPGVQLTP